MEVVRRELGRRSLVEAGQYLMPKWIATRVHDKLAYYLEQVELYIRTEGQAGIGRLIVMMAPREGKTLEVSRLFASWVMGKNPDKKVMLTSYNADLAAENSRAVRDLVVSSRYQALFGENSIEDEPITLSEDSRSSSRWNLAAPHQGGVVSAGVGGGITGKGAHLLIIDDPYKNREEAESDARRELVLNWYKSSAYTRLEKGGAVIVMHARWHRKDLIGELLKAMATDPLADQWVVVCLPALAFDEDYYAKSTAEQQQSLLEGNWKDFKDPLGRQPGEALWPEMFPVDVLERTRVNIGDYDWYSLYQQTPRPLEGGFFNASDFEIVDEAPGDLFWVGPSDLAISTAKTADYNVKFEAALDKEGNFYLRDRIKERGWNEFKVRLKGAMLMREKRGILWGIETVSFQTLAFQEFMKDAELANTAITPLTPDGDKTSRARPLQTRALAHMVKLVDPLRSWAQDFIEEAVDFPNGSHDDQIDAADYGLAMLSELILSDRVWGNFTPDNVVKTDADPTLPVELAIVDGYLFPRAILFIQRLKDGNVLIFDELYHKNHLAEVCIQEAIERVKAVKAESMPEIAVVPEGSEELRHSLRKADIIARQAHDKLKVLDGIAVVRTMICDPTGVRHLLVNERCANLIAEITRGYQITKLGERPDERTTPACAALRHWAYTRAR
jgi:predicted phage terminase large subunit-like protein